MINFLSDVFSSVIQQFIECLLTQRVSFNDSNQPDFPLLHFWQFCSWTNAFSVLMLPSLERTATGIGDNKQPWIISTGNHEDN